MEPRTPKIAQEKPQIDHDKNPKLFVGGLTSTTTEKELLEIFEKIGDIADVVIMYDKVTQRHRGFGFVTYCDPADATYATT